MTDFLPDGVILSLLRTDRQRKELKGACRCPKQGEMEGFKDRQADFGAILCLMASKQLKWYG